MLRGIHPDITYVERDKDAKEIRVAEMRAVRSQAAVLPNEAARSVYIIREADTMRLEAQNAMLKVFEEPAPHVVFLLLCENAERLIATVRSRCAEINLPPHERELPELVERLFAAKSSSEILERALELEKLSKPELIETIAAVKKCALREYSEGRLSGERLEKITENMTKAEKYMAFNVAPGYIAGLTMTAFI